MNDMTSFGQQILQSQPFSVLLGAELILFEIGQVKIVLPVKPEFLQQHGYVHGGVISYLIDNALTFAGGSTLGPDVVTAEFKVNYLRPARGEKLLARAVVEHAGKRLAVCRAEVFTLPEEKRVAIGQGTIATH